MRERWEKDTLIWSKMVKNKIEDLIAEAIAALYQQKNISEMSEREIEVFWSRGEGKGDYATNVVMRLAGRLKMDKVELGEMLIEELTQRLDDKLISKIELVEPGFLNFYLANDFLADEVTRILAAGDDYARSDAGGGEMIQVEFISANSTGALHVGHGRGAFYGDVLANVLDYVGYDCRREFYVNDSKESRQIKMLGELVKGEENPYKTDYVAVILAELLNKEPAAAKLPAGEAGYQLARKIQLANREFIEKSLGIKFDVWFSEEDFRALGRVEHTLNWLRDRGLTYMKDGAEWFRSESLGDEKDRVLVRKSGEETYFLSDIAYHKDKFERGFAKVIDIWGADHHGYVGRMRAAVEAMDLPGKTKDLEIVVTQMARLVKEGKEVKMSKRKGTVIPLSWLIDEVGIDAARFFYLMTAVGTHMDFDLDLAKEQSDKNPVYYVQYAHARVSSILAKAGGIEPKEFDPSRLGTEEERILIREMIKFPELLAMISNNYEVHQITHYLIDLAKTFHNFYQREKVIVAGDEETTKARLGLVLAARSVIKNGLDILGVSAPEKM